MTGCFLLGFSQLSEQRGVLLLDLQNSFRVLFSRGLESPLQCLGFLASTIDFPVRGMAGILEIFAETQLSSCFGVSI